MERHCIKRKHVYVVSFARRNLCKFNSRFQYNKETKEITHIDFTRVYNRPLNYDFEMSLDPHHILTASEAMDMLEYTYPVIMPMLLAELQWIQKQEGLDNTPNEGKDVSCNVEKGI